MEGDFQIYHNGTEEVLNDEFFSSRKSVYILDQNSGVYSGSQIQIDGSSLSNQADYINWSEGYFLIPYVVSAKSAVGAFPVNARRDFIVGLKNGSHQIINNMSVEINGKSMLNLTPYLNEFVSYKMLSEFSENDVKNLGDQLVFHPDTARALTYNGSLNGHTSTLGLTSAYGGSLTMAETLDIDGSNIPSAFNIGLVKRSLSTNYPADASSGVNAVVSSSSFSDTLRSYIDLPAAGTMVAYMTLVIRLKDLSDLFKKLDFPCKGLYCRFQIQVNQGTQVINYTDATTSIAFGSTQVSSNTFPVMWNTDAFEFTAGADDSLTLSCGVASAGGYQHPSLRNCRLYVPTYKMRPEAEAKYLEKGMVKEVVYEDVQQFSVANQSAGSNVNTILTNGIQNPTKLVVVPHLTPTGNGGVSPLLSSVSAEPSTTSPVPLSSWNVLLAGSSVFNTTEGYDFEMFKRFLRDGYAVNSGLSDGISSGLISQDDWQRAYRYYVFDLARRPSETKDVPLSVQIQCKNNALKEIDLHAFITYLRSFKLNLSTGQIL